MLSLSLPLPRFDATRSLPPGLAGHMRPSRSSEGHSDLSISVSCFICGLVGVSWLTETCKEPRPMSRIIAKESLTAWELRTF